MTETVEPARPGPDRASGGGSNAGRDRVRPRAGRGGGRVRRGRCHGVRGRGRQRGPHHARGRVHPAPDRGRPAWPGSAHRDRCGRRASPRVVLAVPAAVVLRVLRRRQRGKRRDPRGVPADARDVRGPLLRWRGRRAGPSSWPARCWSSPAGSRSRWATTSSSVVPFQSEFSTSTGSTNFGVTDAFAFSIRRTTPPTPPRRSRSSSAWCSSVPGPRSTGKRYAGAATPFVAVGAVETLAGCNRARRQRERAARRAARHRRRSGRRARRRTRRPDGERPPGSGCSSMFGGCVAVIADIAPSSAAGVGGIAFGSRSCSARSRGGSRRCSASPTTATSRAPARRHLPAATPRDHRVVPRRRRRLTRFTAPSLRPAQLNLQWIRAWRRSPPSARRLPWG